MDYEKKYKEALEKARQLCAYPTSKPFISDLQDIFPELKESEDEKIRKRIIHALHGDVLEMSEIKEAVAWLEKQGEPKEHDVCDNCDQQGNCVSPCCVKLVEKNSEPTDIPDDAILDGNEDGLIADTIRCKTEKSYEHWSDEQIRINLLSFVNTWGKAKLPLTSVNMFVNYLEKQGEQKPAEWSEDDQSSYNEICNLIYDNYRAEDASRFLTWFNELKDRVQPQPKQEWSEDVEAAIRLLKNIAEEQEKKIIAHIMQMIYEKLPSILKLADLSPLGSRVMCRWKFF